MSEKEIEFIQGLIIKRPSEKAPDFVKAKISIKREELIKWLQGKDTEWINADLKVSKDGKLYASVDNWKPEDKKEEPKSNEIDVKDIPWA